MRNTVLFFVFFGVIVGCNGPVDDVAKLREQQYFLHRAGYEPVRGDVVFTELAPGKIEVKISLVNTDELVNFPAHLHFGTIREAGELAIRLENVSGNTGISYTLLDQVPLSNGDIFTFDMLETMNGSVKIHMAETGVLKNIPIAFGNIGANENYFADGITICTGH